MNSPQPNFLAMKIALVPVIVTVCFEATLFGVDPGETEIKLFYVPFPIGEIIKGRYDESAPADPFAEPVPPDPADYPLKRFEVVKNHFGKVLPGVLHNALPFFEKFDASFSDTDIAWHHPKSGLLIVRTTPENMGFIEEILHSIKWGPDKRLIVSGRTVGMSREKDGQKEIVYDEWKTLHVSGAEMKISKKGAGSVKYDVNLTNYISSDNQTFYYSLELTAEIHGKQFHVKTDSSGKLGSPVNIFLQGSPETGENIRFELTVTDEIVTLIPPVLSKMEMKELHEEIAKILRNRP